MNRRSVLGLIFWLVLCLAVLAVGGAVTATSVGTWYQDLQKPAFNPPNWVFGPVWTALFLLMAIAAWRVWLRAGASNVNTALAVFCVQLALNLGWSFLFFGLQRIGLALVEVVLLLLVVAANTVIFWRIDRPAGVLFVPYVLWVAYATLLTAAVWRLN